MYIPNTNQIYSKKSYPHFLPDNIQKKDPRRNEGRFENSNHRFYYYGKIDIVKEGVGV